MARLARVLPFLLVLGVIGPRNSAKGTSSPSDILSAASSREFGGGLPDETVAVAKKHGLDYPRLVLAAGKGSVPDLRRIMRFTVGNGLDAASSEGHDAVLGELLRRVGDGKFAQALRQESSAVRKAVGQSLDYDTGLSAAGMKRWYPQTAAAVLGRGRQSAHSTPVWQRLFAGNHDLVGVRVQQNPDDGDLKSYAGKHPAMVEYFFHRDGKYTVYQVGFTPEGDIREEFWWKTPPDKRDLAAMQPMPKR